MAFTNEEIIGSVMPRVYVSRIILQSTNKDKLLSNLQFTMKERFANDNISSWIEQDPDILKYFSLMVVESSDQNFTTRLEKLIEEYGTSGDPSIFDAIQRLPNAKVFRPFTGGETLQKMLELDKAEKIDSDPGISEYNIYFDVNFDSGLSENVEHLSYLFFTFYDLTSALSDLNELVPIVRTEEDLQSLGVTEVFLEKVISDSEILSTSYVYTDDEQNIWPGPIHTITRQQNGAAVKVYRSGQTEDSTSIDLQRVEIENNKIQDFRQLDRILKFQKTDVQPIDQETIGSFRNAMLDELQINSDSFISDLFTSIDHQKSIALTFSLDFKQLFLKNSVYGQVLSYIIKSNTEIIENAETGQKIINFNKKAEDAKKLLETLYLMAEIESITVRSKRKDLDDSIASKKQLEEIIFSAQGIEKIAEIERPVLFTNNSKQNQIRTFSLIDKYSKKSGILEYNVELDYHDKTKDFISQIIDLLKLEQRKFKMYYEYAILPNAFNQTTKRFRKNAFNELRAIYVDNETLLENFSAERRRERQQLLNSATSFITPQTSVSRTPSLNNSYYRQSILDQILDVPSSVKTYLSVIEKFFGVNVRAANTLTNTDSILKTVQKWLNPQNGTPETISYVVQIYDELILSLETIVSLTRTVESSLNEKGENTPQQNVDSVSKIVKIKKYFKNNLVNLESRYLLEYLDHEKTDNANIATSDFSFGYEALKVDLINKKMDMFGKLSRPTQNINLQEKSFDNLSEMLGDFGNLGVYDNPYYIKNREMGLEVSARVPNRIREELRTAYEKAVISAKKEILSKNASLESDDKVALNPTLLKLLRPTLSQNTKNIKFLKGYSTTNFCEKVDISKARLGLESIPNTDVILRTITDLISGVTFTKQYLPNIPNQIKSLFQLRANNPEVFVNDAESRFKYEMLKQIQYLEGFEFRAEEDIFIMNSPIWKTLTGLQSLQTNNQKILFCRIVDHTDQKISYKFNAVLKEQSTNEHFFINNLNYHQAFLIKNGATNISLNKFEKRCIKELQKYFEGDEQPSVNFTIGTEQIGTTDSYLNTKYSFLAPYGVHFDNIYKIIGVYNLAFETLIPTFSIITTQDTDEGTDESIQSRFSGFRLLTDTPSVVRRPSLSSNFLATIYSKSK